MDVAFAIQHFVFDIGSGPELLVGGPAVTLVPDVDDGVLTVGDTLVGQGASYTYQGTGFGGIVVTDVNGFYHVLTDLPGQTGLPFNPETDIEAEDFIYCFAAGTLIETAKGLRPIEAIEVGDLVRTMDNGMQPVRWISFTKVSPAMLKLQPHKRPIRIKAGALGNDRDLVVSPEHRVLVTGWRAEVLLGQTEVLIAARDLVNDSTIIVDPAPEGVEYWHMMFDNHEIVWAEGCPSESFNPGDVALDKMQTRARRELLDLFPDLAQTDWVVPARRVVSSAEARLV